jgi:hypothetical protein
MCLERKKAKEGGRKEGRKSYSTENLALYHIGMINGVEQEIVEKPSSLN